MNEIIEQFLCFIGFHDGIWYSHVVGANVRATHVCRRCLFIIRRCSIQIESGGLVDGHHHPTARFRWSHTPRGPILEQLWESVRNDLPPFWRALPIEDSPEEDKRS